MSSTTAKIYDRVLADRRRRPTPMFSRYWLRGRRRGGRRQGEIERVYVDVYTRSELALVLGLLFLSVVDLVLTEQHLSVGGAEANPVMAFVLQAGGARGFALVKVALTLPAAVVLLVHQRFRLARRAMVVLFAVYACLMVWHAVVILGRTG